MKRSISVACVQDNYLSIALMGRGERIVEGSTSSITVVRGSSYGISNFTEACRCRIRTWGTRWRGALESRNATHSSLLASRGARPVSRNADPTVRV